MHCIGDQLWIHYGKPELPDLGVPDNLGFLDEKNNDETSEEEEFEKIPKVDEGGFQLLDLIITELKSHMTCYNSMPLIG